MRWDLKIRESGRGQMRMITGFKALARGETGFEDRGIWNRGQME